jgi:hypothetical protein
LNPTRTLLPARQHPERQPSSQPPLGGFQKQTAPDKDKKGFLMVWTLHRAENQCATLLSTIRRLLLKAPTRN